MEQKENNSNHIPINLLEPGVLAAHGTIVRGPWVLPLVDQIGFLFQESTFAGPSLFSLLFCHEIFITHQSHKSVPSWRCTSISSSYFASGDELLKE